MRHSAEYEVWKSMRGRCSRPTDKRYASYGGRGIRVCEEWDRDFEAFYRDMGPRPSPKHSVERRDVNGNYEPANCLWLPIEEQARNRTNNRVIEHDGQTLCAAEWARKVGISPQHLITRLKQGWSVADAITCPKGTKNPGCRKGNRGS